MKAFRDLKLIGSISDQERLIELIEQKLSNGWRRDREREAELKSVADYIVFTCSETVSRPAVSLSFVADENSYLYLNNIVAKELKDLSKDQYNAVLEEFLTQFVESAAIGLGIRIITTPDEQTIDNTMSSDMSRLLKKISDSALKATGTHALDEQRFFDFIIQAHRERSLLDDTKLRGLLIDAGWSNTQAQELSFKYRFSRDLLNRYSDQG